MFLWQLEEAVSSPVLRKQNRAFFVSKWTKKGPKTTYLERPKEGRTQPLDG